MNMRIDAPGIRPEIVAVIMASICTMYGSGEKLVIKIKHSSESWKMAGRQKVMDIRQF